MKLILQKNSSKSLALLILAMLIFGTIGILRKSIPVSSSLIAFIRGIIGALFMLIFVKKKDFAALDKKTMFKLIISGAFLGLNWLFLFESYNYTSVAIGSLFCYTNPMIVIIMSAILFREKITARKFFCLALSMLGMVLISGVIESGMPSQNDLKGILFALACACCYASVVLISKHTESPNAYLATLIQLLSAGLVMVPYILFTDGFTGGLWDTRTVILMLYLSLVNTGIGYALYFGAMRDLSTQTVAILSYIDPVTALIASFLILGESMTLLGLIGAGLILVSSAICEI